MEAKNAHAPAVQEQAIESGKKVAHIMVTAGILRIYHLRPAAGCPESRGPQIDR